MAHQMMEPLIMRDMTGAMVPALARIRALTLALMAWRSLGMGPARSFLPAKLKGQTR